MRSDAGSNGVTFALQVGPLHQKEILITRSWALMVTGVTAETKWNSLFQKDGLRFLPAVTYHATKDISTSPRDFQSVAYGTILTRSTRKRKSPSALHHKTLF